MSMKSCHLFINFSVASKSIQNHFICSDGEDSKGTQTFTAITSTCRIYSGVPHTPVSLNPSTSKRLLKTGQRDSKPHHGVCCHISPAHMSELSTHVLRVLTFQSRCIHYLFLHDCLSPKLYSQILSQLKLARRLHS